MIDLNSIQIRHVNSVGIAYGEPVDHDDLSWEVTEEIADEIIQHGKDMGEVEVGGQRYRWRREG